MTPPIPFTDFGGQGRKLVFFHGNGFPPESYAQLLQPLTHHYHVLGMHSRTMWQRDVPNDLLSWKIFSRDIDRFIVEQDLQDSILVGHSFGGLAALRTLMDHPKLHNPLILLDPVLVSPKRLIAIWWALLFNRATKSRRLQAGALRRRRTFASLAEAFDAYNGKPIFSKFSESQLRAFIDGLLIERDGRYELRIAPEWEAKVYETAIYKDLDIFQKIPFFSHKAMVIWGTASDTLRPDAIQFLKFINRNFIIKPIEGASHLVPFERPEHTARIILNYLSEQS